jgi:beta-N-acetylglucosaminidase
MRIDKKLQASARIAADQEVTVTLVQTKNWPEPTLPGDVAAALARAPQKVNDKWQEEEHQRIRQLEEQQQQQDAKISMKNDFTFPVENQTQNNSNNKMARLLVLKDTILKNILCE